MAEGREDQLTAFRGAAHLPAEARSCVRRALPALLVGTTGTVNSGAIDALADVASADHLWFHVDGAYGAFGVLDPAIAARFGGMERAGSLVLDPHEWLGVPVDAGCALVRQEAIQARGRAFVTGTVFGGRETLRACVLHPDTTSEHLATLISEVGATARTLAAGIER